MTIYSSLASRLSVWPCLATSPVVLSTQIAVFPGSTFLGSVPFMKYSRRVGQRLLGSSCGSRPDVEQMYFEMTSGGLGVSFGSCPFNTCDMSLFQMGAAPVSPETTPLMGVRSLLPTQTATTYLGV